jgi:hypothetical protein
MKDVLFYLLSYPVWVKAVVVALLSICALLLLVFKPDPPKELVTPKMSSIAVNIGVNQGGNVAGRDIVVNNGPTGAQTDELVRVLQARAQRIQNELAPKFKDVEVKKFLQQFDELHRSHIDALRRNNLVEAHEYLTQVHAISRELQASEFWAREAKRSLQGVRSPQEGPPRIAYSVKPDAFQRGKMIEWYVGTKGMEILITESMRTPMVEGTSPAQSAHPEDIYAHLNE